MIDGILALFGEISVEGQKIASDAIYLLERVERQQDRKPLMNRLPESNNDKRIAFLFVRLAMAISMLTHGIVRLPKLGAFSEGMVDQFSESMLPDWLVWPLSYTIPVIEFALGVTLLLGFLTRLSALAGAFLMLVLLAGSGMVEAWSSFPTQLIHLAFFVAILLYHRYDSYALDNRLRR